VRGEQEKRPRGEAERFSGPKAQPENKEYEKSTQFVERRIVSRPFVRTNTSIKYI